MPSPTDQPARPPLDLAKLVADINHLPADWHDAGTFMSHVMVAFAEQAAQRPIRHSVETGAGRSTLLLSHLSAQHTVFSLDQGDSLSSVRRCPLLRESAVTFVDGPTQATLPSHTFAGPLDLVLLDGPHAFPFVELEYYHLYPKVAEGGLLVIDDIHIPTIHNMYKFLRECEMWSLQKTVHTTAFFRRTAAPVFDPMGDSWWLQGYNKRKFPQFPQWHLYAVPLLSKILPQRVKTWLTDRAGRSAARRISQP